MDTLNSPAIEQDGPGLDSPENSPVAAQDGAGDRTKDRIDSLMGLANRRLTAQQRAEEERDAALAEIEALRASVEDGWEAERADYWQHEPVASAAADTAASDAPAEGEGDEPEPPPMVMGVNPPRSASVPIRSSSPLEEARAAFSVAAEAENERLKHLLDWP